MQAQIENVRFFFVLVVLFCRCWLLFQRHTIESISLTAVSSSFSMSDQLRLDQLLVDRVAVSAKFVSDFNILCTQYFNGATCILCSGFEE